MIKLISKGLFMTIPLEYQNWYKIETTTIRINIVFFYDLWPMTTHKNRNLKCALVDESCGIIFNILRMPLQRIVKFLPKQVNGLCTGFDHLFQSKYVIKIVK